jgi:hypothetical protein
MNCRDPFLGVIVSRLVDSEFSFRFMFGRIRLQYQDSCAWMIWFLRLNVVNAVFVFLGIALVCEATMRTTE